uniref:Uncharacterized protein AlNc14C109G6332 n=1 Tax=Albugo laibachii Nc14 TaxID=890382 RepID=F0WID1_9STRA|nr:conserved hypothetical protein [Albugo laibachii Nc14]|eukprot:CCA21012.1 conserved hypothetical protein [Albugo laibachii Nc14]
MAEEKYYGSKQSSKNVDEDDIPIAREVHPSQVYGVPAPNDPHAGMHQQETYHPTYGQPPSVDAYGRPVVTAMPYHTQPQVVANNSHIMRDAQGNALCKKCSVPYPLPHGCTSWRCRNCQELNNASIYGDECCTIL